MHTFSGLANSTHERSDQYVAEHDVHRVLSSYMMAQYIQHPRQKKRHLLLTLLYRLSKLPFAGPDRKMRLYLDLNWIFWRLSLEQGERMWGFGQDSMRLKNLQFLFTGIRPSDRVLDLGCRYGHISALIAERAEFVLGVDLNKEALALAERTHQAPNLRFEHGEAMSILKARSDRFDVLVLSHLLEHLDEPKAFLRSYVDHFDRIYIEVPDLDDSYLNHYRAKVNAQLNYTDGDHIWEFDREALQEVITSSGLEVVSVEYRYGLQKYWCRKAR
jgi:2-polyprenyl-3-methyl-5-hydroxy-6-metoxy-1,4-benzoquinol methylase